MEREQMCRVCLAEELQMYVVANYNMHELYEKLTDKPFVTEDRRPILLCYFCCTLLKKFCRFQRKCLIGEELFSKMLDEDHELKPFVKQEPLEYDNGLSIVQLEQINILSECHAVGEESPDDGEGAQIDDECPEKVEDTLVHQDEDLKTSHRLESEVEVEQVTKENGSASDTINEDLKTSHRLESEVEVEQVTKENGSASDTIRMPIVLVQKLDARRANPGHRITEEQGKDLDTSQNSKLEDAVTSNLEEVSTEKQSASDTKRVPVVLLPKLKLHKTAEDQQKNENTLAKVPATRSRTAKPQPNNSISTTSLDKKHFKCELCHRSFTYKSSLMYHNRTHTGEKPFKCNYCQRSFCSSSNLKKHIKRLHTGDKPYKCNMCKFSFRSKRHLNRHIRTHT